MRLIALAVVDLFAGGNAIAGDLTTPQQTQDICQSAANKFASGDIDGAFDVLIPYWPLPKEEVKAIAYQSKAQLDMVSGRYGQPLGAEYVRTETVGKSLIKQTFLIKFSKHALRMSCVFYKPEKVWLMNSTSWDDKPQDFF